VIAFLLLAVLVMASCAPAAPEVEETPGVEEAPEAEKTLVMVSPSLASRIDPCGSLIGPSGEIVANTQGYWVVPKTIMGEDGFVRDDIAAGEDGMDGGLFESWEASDDGTVWTMHLREGIVDCDGNEFNAEDAKWIFDRIVSSPQCSYVTSAIGVKDVNLIEVLDDHTLQITLPGPSPVFLRVMHVVNGMAFGARTVREHATDDDPWAYEWAETNAPGLGPFCVESWTPGEEMVLVRNPNYWGDPPKVDRVIYRAVPEASNRVALLLSGDAHVARDLTQEQLDTVGQSDEAQSICIPATLFVYLALNTQEGPTAVKEVRQALAYATPYDDVIGSVYRGRARSLWSFVVGDVQWVVPEEDNPYEYDLAKAEALLEEGGYADGFDLELMINGGFPEHERIAVLLKDSWGKIGVNLTIDKQPSSVFFDRGFAHDLQSAIGQDYSYVQDVYYHSDLWLYDGPPPNDNFSGYSNATFNDLAAESAHMPEGSERGAKLTEMQEIFIEDSAWIFLANPPTCYGMSNKVVGYSWHIAQQVLFKDLDITE